MTDFKFKTAPYAHQLKVWDESKDREEWALLLEMGCVDADTEFLSPTGWIKISEWDRHDVAQYNADTKNITFAQPERYIVKPCDEMLHFTARGMDMMLTQDHTMLWHDYRGRNRYGHAAEVAERSVVKIPAAAFLHESVGQAMPEPELRVRVMVAADGYFPKQCNTTRCYVRLKKERKKARIRQILRAAGIDYDERPCKPAGFRKFSFAAPERKKMLDYWSLDIGGLRVIVDEIRHWDGHITNKGTLQFSSMDRESADFVQYAAAVTGHKTFLSVDSRPGRNDCFRVSISQARPLDRMWTKKNSKMSSVPAPGGKQYCFTMPDGHLILRRNGCVYCTHQCGKSKVTIDTIAYLALKNEINAVLVIAPNGVHRQWVTGEIPVHISDNIDYRAVIWQSSKNTKEYRKELDSLLKPGAGIAILAMNVEAFSTAKGTEFADKFLSRWPDNLVVVDESSKIKTVRAKRTKNIVKLRTKAKYRRILTGTPVTQSPLDVYSQFFFLCPTILGFSSYTAFKSQYAITIKNNATDGSGRMYQYENIVGYRRLEELSDKISHYSSRILKVDCLDLPEKIYQTIPVEMTPEQRRLYAKLKEDLLLEVGEENIPVPLVLTQLLRLQQLTGGNIGQEDGTTLPIDGGNPKLNALLDDVDTLSIHDRVIVWARFRAEIEALVAALNKTYGAGCAAPYYGGVSTTERANTIERFTKGDIRFFVANAQCGGMGLNLTSANIVYYFSNTFSLEERLQSEDRCHRIGQKKNVVYRDLICVGTIDEKVKAALRAKKNIADIVTGDGVRTML